MQTSSGCPGTQGSEHGERLSVRNLCGLFCCPPLPSAIASKLAFFPPPPTYRINYDDPQRAQLELLEGRAEWLHETAKLRNVEVFFTTTRRRNKIACMYVKTCESPRFTILFSHGNAVDIGLMCSFYYALGCLLKCNVFSYDYSGYGRSSGKPSEKNVYADIVAAFTVLRTQYQVPTERMILYGQSIGTVPSVELASAEGNLAGLVLHSPLTSGMRVACPGLLCAERAPCCDVFPSIEKIRSVRCPTLVIHGTDDEVIDVSHGMSIYEVCPTSVEPLWLSGTGHNDVELRPAYFERLLKFVDSEVLRR